jgi:D-alanine--D-alanine ligase
MHIALTYDVQSTTSAAPTEAEPPAISEPPSTIAAIEAALQRAGHDVTRVEVQRPLSLFLARLESLAPDLVFNQALGSKDQTRTTFYPTLFDELGLPHTDLDAYDDQLDAAKNQGNDFDEVIRAIVRSACERHGLHLSSAAVAKRVLPSRLRVGLTFNLKREGGIAEAEFDSPTTINAVAEAIESLGHTVVQLEAKPDLPRRLLATKPDVIFNIAEGFRGRGREAQVPAMLELLGIPYSGSDATTMSLCLDKGLTKQILRASGIATPEWQVLVTGREVLKAFRYPVIVKPNAEGTSKGISASSVVHDEASARAAVRTLLEQYGQPALVEEYIAGREFTVGLLGHHWPRVLPPLEIVFLNDDATPVYGYEEKQKWMEHMRWDCPATLDPEESNRVEKTALDTFIALHCRDVARIDLRMAHDGTVYVIECNPLPGLAPDYSDLSTIAKAARLDFPALVAEILRGCIERFHDQRVPTFAAASAEAAG